MVLQCGLDIITVYWCHTVEMQLFAAARCDGRTLMPDPAVSCYSGGY
jgi:hypothetical protein